MENIRLETQIHAVTAYSNQATLSRAGQVDLPTGKVALSLIGLPQDLDPESLRVKVFGKSPARLLDVKVRSEQFQNSPDKKVQELESQIKSIENQKETIQGNLDILSERTEFIKSLRVAHQQGVAESLKNFAPKPEDWKSVLSFISEEMAENLAQKAGLDQQMEELEERQTVLEAELEQLEGVSTAVRLVATVELEIVEAGTYLAEVTYLDRRVQWVPQYDARLDTQTGIVTLRGIGMIRQETGENWSGVDLLLSSARPKTGNPPVLSPVFLQERVVLPPAALQASARVGGAPGMIDEEAKEMTRSIPPKNKMKKMAEGIAAEAEVVGTDGASVAFRPMGSGEVPGDGSSTRLVLFETELPGKVIHFAIPRISDSVFRKAKLSNGSAFPFLPGNIQIFVDDMFNGKSSLTRVTWPEETFELPLGIDESVRVERKAVKEMGDQKGFFSKSKVHHFEFLTTIENLRSGPIEMVVQDLVPESRDERIKVTVEKLLPAENPEKDKDALAVGALEWKVAIPAKEKCKLALNYSVEYPLGMEVTGL